jgi:hypothetical protein
MDSVVGFTQMGMRPAAGDARTNACAGSGRTLSYLAWQADAAAMDAKQAISDFVDVPATPTTHRHRRPWGTS